MSATGPSDPRSAAPLATWRDAARAVQTARATGLVPLPSPTAWLSRRVGSAGFPWRAPTVPGGVELPREPKRTGTRYETAWARSEPARYVRAALVEGPLRLLVWSLADPEVHGTDRLAGLDTPARRRPRHRPGARTPETDGGRVLPVVFVANHHSHLDTMLLATSIPEPWRHRLVVGAAADYFFATRLTGALSALAIGAIPFERSQVGRRSAELAADLVDDGWSLLLFPEGGRSPDGWGQPFRGGAAWLAQRCDVPVVPVHLAGTDRILPKGRNVPKPARTRVTFGAPLWPQPEESSRRFAVRLERAVAALADEATTDWWSARRRAASGETPPLTGPDAPSWRRQWALDERGRAGARRRRQKRSWPRLDGPLGR